MQAPSRATLKSLERLGRDEKNRVWVVSGRPRAILETYFGGLPVSIAAEHGRFYRTAWAGSPPSAATVWDELVPDPDLGWMEEVQRILAVSIIITLSATAARPIPSPPPYLPPSLRLELCFEAHTFSTSMFCLFITVISQTPFLFFLLFVFFSIFFFCVQ